MLLGSSIQLPLFDSSRFDTQLGVARAQRNEMIADYNQSVQHAVAEVAAEGVTLQGLERQATAHAATQQASAALVATATRRVNHGLADRAALLQARQAMMRQVEIGLQLQDASLQAELALIKALGGGYQAQAQADRGAPRTAANTTSTQQH